MYSFIDLKSFNKNDKEIPVKLDRYKTETLKPITLQNEYIDTFEPKSRRLVEIKQNEELVNVGTPNYFPIVREKNPFLFLGLSNYRTEEPLDNFYKFNLQNKTNTDLLIDNYQTELGISNDYNRRVKNEIEGIELPDLMKEENPYKKGLDNIIENIINNEKEETERKMIKPTTKVIVRKIIPDISPEKPVDMDISIDENEVEKETESEEVESEEETQEEVKLLSNEQLKKNSKKKVYDYFIKLGILEDNAKQQSEYNKITKNELIKWYDTKMQNLNITDILKLKRGNKISTTPLKEVEKQIDKTPLKEIEKEKEPEPELLTSQQLDTMKKKAVFNYFIKTGLIDNNDYWHKQYAKNTRESMINWYSDTLSKMNDLDRQTLGKTGEKHPTTPYTTFKKKTK